MRPTDQHGNDLRSLALDYAVQSQTVHTAAGVVAAAETYLAFLIGEDEPAE